jgi:hypothetical protein
MREPGTLRDITVQKLVNLCCGACERWISHLYAAARSSSSAYSNISRSVEAECREIKSSLSELPHSLLEISSPQLTRKFTYIIAHFNLKMSSLELEHKSLCTAMFRSVLTPYLYEHGGGTVEFYLTENLILQSLDSVPG